MAGTARSAGFHHVAYACRDSEATRHFYEDLLGMPLVHTEIKNGDNGFFRHLFFDTGDGSFLAFFEVSGVGEVPGWRSEVSVGNGLPVWVNHVALAADEKRTEEVRQRLDACGIVPLMEVDHGWCHSLYFIDPNGIMVELCRDIEGFATDPESASQRLRSNEDTDASVIIQNVTREGLRGFDPLPTYPADQTGEDGI